MCDLILWQGADRYSDRYIEVHIYGELNWQALGKVSLDGPLTRAEDRENWEFARQKLLRNHVAISVRVVP